MNLVDILYLVNLVTLVILVVLVNCQLSGNKDCHESRFSIVSIVISVPNVTSPYDRSFRV